VLQQRLDQRGAAAGDETVDETAQAHELDSGLVRGVLHQRHRVFWKAGFDGSPAQDRHDRLVGGQRAGRSPQEGGIAGLEAEPGGIARHVGAVLVDDADHTEGHPHPGHP
jgi:hypothetical protein